MRTATLACLFLVAAAVLAAAVALPSRAMAQAPQPKVAVANLSKIFLGMKETQEIKQRLDADRKALVDEELSKRKKVEELRSALELIKPDAPQYEEANKQFVQEAIAFKNWGEFSQSNFARREKVQTKLLYDKITAVIADMAKERGIDLVIAEQPPINIEKLTVDQLQQLMAQRQVLYASATVDITSDVIAKLDERFNAMKK